MYCITIELEIQFSFFTTLNSLFLSRSIHSYKSAIIVTRSGSKFHMVLEPIMASTTDTAQTSHTTTTHTATQPHSTPSPLLLLSNMSNLMSIKLDYTNYIPWKHQLITILEAYSLIEHIDGSITQPCQFLLDTQGNLTTSVNPDFLTWRIKDKALLSLINSTLTPQVFSLVVGIITSREVWNTLKQRFTSTSRANILNLKLEL